MYKPTVVCQLVHLLRVTARRRKRRQEINIFIYKLTKLDAPTYTAHFLSATSALASESSPSKDGQTCCAESDGGSQVTAVFLLLVAELMRSIISRP